MQNVPICSPVAKMWAPLQILVSSQFHSAFEYLHRLVRRQGVPVEHHLTAGLPFRSLYGSLARHR